MKVPVVLSFILSLAVVLSSCYNDTYEDLYVDPASPDLCDTLTNVSTYSGGVKNILTSECAISGCHDAATKQSGFDFSTYADAKLIADNGRLVIVTAVQKTMPKTSSLSECQIKQIVNWVNHGALNN